MGSGVGEGLLQEDLIVTVSYQDGSIGTVTYAEGGHASTTKERLEILGRGHSVLIDDFATLRVDGKGVKLAGSSKGHVENLRAFRSALDRRGGGAGRSVGLAGVHSPGAPGGGVTTQRRHGERRAAPSETSMSKRVSGGLGRLAVIGRDLARIGTDGSSAGGVRGCQALRCTWSDAATIRRRGVDSIADRRSRVRHADRGSRRGRSRTLADARPSWTRGTASSDGGSRFSDPRTGSRSPARACPGPAMTYWWDIDIRTDQRLGDVKWTWELGRHRDLVVLARAAALEPQGPWLDALEARLRGWFEIAAPEVGIHWYSNLEIALRIIAWMQIHSLVGEQLDPRSADDHGRARRPR